ncbi:MAG: penicillin-binding protein 2 [Acidimicrobiales bacterium]
MRAGLRLSVMGIVVLGLFSMMIFRLWSLQVLHSSAAISNVNSLVTRAVPITPPRGIIEARSGQVIVANKVQPVVTLSRQVAANDPAVVKRLAVLLGIPLSQIQASINDQQISIYQPVPVQVGVSASTIVYLAEHRSMFPGVRVTNVAEREYPYGALASQMLGYVGAITPSELQQLKGKGYTQGDMMGQAGLEFQYESYLHGSTGVRQLLVDAAGMPVGTKHVTPARPGSNVVLNLDLGLQRAAQSDLAAQIQTLNSSGPTAGLVHSGAVVVENTQNGAILAMASYPTYNPSWWVGGMSTQHYKQLTGPNAHQPLLNRAIQGLYTPGSVFKLATATAALNAGLITPNTYVHDPGYFTVPGMNCATCTFHNNAGESCGSCNIVTAISMSDDVFFYTLGYWFYSRSSQYGNEAIQKVAQAYGLGEPTGVDLPAQAVGQVDGPALRVLQHKMAPKAFPYSSYTAGDAVNMAFGQGETVITPLQLANAYATFANGGTRYAPEVAAEIISPTGKVLKRIKPRVLGHVPIAPANRQAMLSGFEGALTNPIGTAYYTVKSMGYPYAKFPLAGKTGTSQVSNNPNAQPDALFVAFGPTYHPKYVIAAVIPRGGYGDFAAAPIVLKLFEYLMSHPVPPLAPSVPSGG